MTREENYLAGKSRSAGKEASQIDLEIQIQDCHIYSYSTQMYWDFVSVQISDA